MAAVERLRQGGAAVLAPRAGQLAWIRRGARPVSGAQIAIGGRMRLTPAGKILLFLVGLGVLGYAAWTYRGRLPSLSGTGASPPAASPAAGTPAASALGAGGRAQGRARQRAAVGGAARRHGARRAAASLHQRPQAGGRLRLPPRRPHRRRHRRQARAGRRGRLRGSARPAARRRHRHHHGRLRARSVDRRRRVVERLPGFRPVPDRAGGHGVDVPVGPATWPASASPSTTTRRPNAG